MSAHRPWHLMPIAVLALLWALATALDYLLSQLAVAPYLALFTEDQVNFVFAMPQWVDAVWALGVWTGVLGAMGLYWQWRGAAIWLSGSAGAMAVLTLWALLLASPGFYAVAGQPGLVLLAAGVTVPAVLWLYARAMHGAGVLP